jgi:hypothetical protein
MILLTQLGISKKDFKKIKIRRVHSIMRKQTKIAAVVSAAALLAIGASMTSFAATGWQEENGTWVYYDRNGNMVTGDWAKSGDNWFYLGDNGEMVRDALVDKNENTYYVDANGAMVTNKWVEVDNANDDSEDAPATVWYYFQANGKAYKAPTSGKTSFKTINGKKYAFDVDGKMLFGWVDDNSTRQTGDDAWTNGLYFLGEANDGSQTVGSWRQLLVTDNSAEDPEQNYWFYFQNNGKKYTDTEKTINSKKYRFDERGKMVSEWWSTPSNASAASAYNYYSSPEEGAKKTKGWFKVVPGEYFDRTDYDDDTARWFYADGKGKLYINAIKTINGKKYLFDEDGEMLTGLRYVTFTGNDVTSTEELDDQAKLDQFTKVGTTVTTNGKNGVYYFVDNGDMVTGNQSITVDGDSYSFRFKNSGSAKGVGASGKEKDAYFVNGRKVQADSDTVYAVYAYNSGTERVTAELKSEQLVNTTWKRYKNQRTETTGTGTGDLLYRGSQDHYNSAPVAAAGADKVIVVNTSGTVVTNGTRKDGNEVRLVTRNGYLKGAYINE